MTAFSVSDLPAALNSVEKVVVWGTSILSYLYEDLTVIESPGTSDFAALCSPFFVSASSPPGFRCITRASLPLNLNWRQVGKLWLSVQDLGTESIPLEFKS